jgi:hypothetical protein
VPLFSDSGIEYLSRKLASSDFEEAWLAAYLLCFMHGAIQPVNDDAKAMRSRIRALLIRTRLQSLLKRATTSKHQRSIREMLDYLDSVQEARADGAGSSREAGDGRDVATEKETARGLLYRAAVSRGTVTHVDSKDPTGELEDKLRYLTEDELSLLRDADNEYVDCRWYFVVRLVQPGVYRIRVTCRATGNHQIIAHSPRNSIFPLKDFREVDEFQTITLDFDARQSQHLILNCTRGSIQIDAMTVEKDDG